MSNESCSSTDDKDLQTPEVRKKIFFWVPKWSMDEDPPAAEELPFDFEILPDADIELPERLSNVPESEKPLDLVLIGCCKASLCRMEKAITLHEKQSPGFFEKIQFINTHADCSGQCQPRSCIDEFCIVPGANMRKSWIQECKKLTSNAVASQCIDDIKTNSERFFEKCFRCSAGFRKKVLIWAPNWPKAEPHPVDEDDLFDIQVFTDSDSQMPGGMHIHDARVALISCCKGSLARMHKAIHNRKWDNAPLMRNYEMFFTRKSVVEESSEEKCQCNKRCTTPDEVVETTDTEKMEEIYSPSKCLEDMKAKNDTNDEEDNASTDPLLKTFCDECKKDVSQEPKEENCDDCGKKKLPNKNNFSLSVEMYVPDFMPSSYKGIVETWIRKIKGKPLEEKPFNDVASEDNEMEVEEQKENLNEEEPSENDQERPLSQPRLRRREGGVLDDDEEDRPPSKISRPSPLPPVSPRDSTVLRSPTPRNLLSPVNAPHQSPSPRGPAADGQNTRNRRLSGKDASNEDFFQFPAQKKKNDDDASSGASGDLSAV